MRVLFILVTITFVLFTGDMAHARAVPCGEIERRDIHDLFQWADKKTVMKHINIQPDLKKTCKTLQKLERWVESQGEAAFYDGQLMYRKARINKRVRKIFMDMLGQLQWIDTSERRNGGGLKSLDQAGMVAIAENTLIEYGKKLGAERHKAEKLMKRRVKTGLTEPLNE